MKTSKPTKPAKREVLMIDGSQWRFYLGEKLRLAEERMNGMDRYNGSLPVLIGEITALGETIQLLDVFINIAKAMRRIRPSDRCFCCKGKLGKHPIPDIISLKTKPRFYCSFSCVIPLPK